MLHENKTTLHMRKTMKNEAPASDDEAGSKLAGIRVKYMLPITKLVFDKSSQCRGMNTVNDKCYLVVRINKCHPCHNKHPNLRGLLTNHLKVL